MEPGSQIEDAEVVESGPRPPPPPPRVAELKPAGDSFGVFDGQVDDAPNAKKRPVDGAAAREKAKSRAKGKKPEAPPVDPAVELLERQRKARRTAEQLVDTFFNFQLNLVRERYASIIGPADMQVLLERLKPIGQEREGWVGPLAEGCLDNEIELPWWAALGMQAVISIGARRAMLEQLELTYRAKKEADEAAAKAAAPDKKP